MVIAFQPGYGSKVSAACNNSEARCLGMHSEPYQTPVMDSFSACPWIAWCSPSLSLGEVASIPVPNVRWFIGVVNQLSYGPAPCIFKAFAWSPFVRFPARTTSGQ
jgi:hypothetical protein